MNIASIDIGTNTILLLIANVNLRAQKIDAIREEIRIPRIGVELNRSGKIPDEKIAELENILLEYKNLAKLNNCEEIFVIGTHALRTASNNKEIQSRILDKTSLFIEIIPSELEAEYAFYGIKASCKMDGIFAIVDIGGGSTEVIFGDKDSILDKISFPIGVVTLKDEFIQDYPISESDDANLKKKIKTTFKELTLKHYAPKTLIGISGTPTTLSVIQNNLKTFDSKKLDNTQLSKTEITNILEILRNSSIESIKNTYGEIISKREDILYIGGVILLNVMDYLNVTDTKVSTYGIRHGVIYKKMIVNK
ncbi:MAG: hypothetical protein WC209_10410 [Ignavibacteriaceae bacterium]|jgi:exopolyphosphatase/guanosine-5'-triphosphate,3'-diphosphate pyrophosphatase